MDANLHPDFPAMLSFQPVSVNKAKAVIDTKAEEQEKLAM